MERQLGLLREAEEVAQTEGWDFHKPPLVLLFPTLNVSWEPKGFLSKIYPKAVHFSTYALLRTSVQAINIPFLETSNSLLTGLPASSSYLLIQSILQAAASGHALKAQSS